MDDPVAEITDIVLRLTQAAPKVQEETINTYFTPNASFTHPFCRTGSFEGSRMLIHAIFRWYKIMSPNIEARVNGIGYDEANLTLYVNISQTFAICFVPFHRSPVTLTTQLQLTHKPSPTNPTTKKYYIESQNDLYAVDQFVKFFAPWGIGTTVVYMWHFFATAGCVLLAVLFSWFTSLEERWAGGQLSGWRKVVMSGVERVEERRMGLGGSSRVGRQEIADEVHEVANGLKQDVEVEKDDAKQFGNMQVVT